MFSRTQIFSSSCAAVLTPNLLNNGSFVNVTFCCCTYCDAIYNMIQFYCAFGVESSASKVTLQSWTTSVAVLGRSRNCSGHHVRTHPVWRSTQLYIQWVPGAPRPAVNWVVRDVNPPSAQCGDWDAGRWALTPFRPRGVLLLARMKSAYVRSHATEDAHMERIYNN
jgi:hypothetical protein